jgi:hypothetical protein
MAELAYEKDHPAHPDNKGKPMPETHTDFGYDYARTHPARAGQGQPVPTDNVTGLPRDSFKHLHGLPGATLREAQAAFNALGQIEQDRRMEWNKNGIPADLLEEG